MAADPDRPPLPDSPSPAAPGEGDPWPRYFVTRTKSVATGFLVLAGALLALGVVGMALGLYNGDRHLLVLAGLYEGLVVVLCLFFLRFARQKHALALSVAEERLREEAARQAAEKSVCQVCERFAEEGLIPCSLCDRMICVRCRRQEEGDPVIERPYCPVCWEAGETFRERMLEAEIECDEKRERLEAQFKASALRLAGQGRPDARKLKRLDDEIGERCRENILVLEQSLEADKERLRELWRAEAMRRLSHKAPESGKPAHALDLEAEETAAPKPGETDDTG